MKYIVGRYDTWQPRSGNSGFGRYSRMRGIMVRHLHLAHRSALEETAKGEA